MTHGEDRQVESDNHFDEPWIFSTRDRNSGELVTTATEQLANPMTHLKNW